MNEPRDIEILQALFVGDDVEDAELVRAVRGSEDDEAFRATYDELAFADRALGGDLEARVGEALFLDALDQMLDEEADASPQGETSAHVVSLDDYRTERPVQMWVAAAALAFLSIGTLVQTEQRQATERPEYQARSAASVDEPEYEEPSFEVFCVQRDGDEVSFVGQRESEFATVRCSRDAEIKLAVRNPDPDLRYAAFFGIANDNTLYWYGPSPAAANAVPVDTTRELRPIGETIRLAVNHEPGVVRVVGIFAEQPITFERVRRYIGSNMWQLRDGQLTVDRGTVVRQTFEVSEP